MIGSSPRGHKALAQRTAGGTFGHLLDGLPEHSAGAGGPAKLPPRTHGMGQVSAVWHTLATLASFRCLTVPLRAEMGVAPPKEVAWFG